MDKPTVVKIKPNSIGFVPYSFDQNFARVFNSNAIVFINLGATTVLINSVFTLLPSLLPGTLSGASISFNGNQNEIDSTIWQIAFVGAGVKNLQVWIKEDKGLSLDGAKPMRYEDIDMTIHSNRSIKRRLEAERSKKRIVYRPEKRK